MLNSLVSNDSITSLGMLHMSWSPLPVTHECPLVPTPLVLNLESIYVYGVQSRYIPEDPAYPWFRFLRRLHDPSGMQLRPDGGVPAMNGRSPNILRIPVPSSWRFPMLAALQLQAGNILCLGSGTAYS